MNYSLCGVCVVFLAALLSRVTAQAPGDGDPFCADLHVLLPFEYHANIKILMDSFDYFNLLSLGNLITSVWQQVDNDMGGQFTSSWYQSTNRPCRQSVSICSYSNGYQDNWLITQYISRVVNVAHLPQVSVQVEFQFIGCIFIGCQMSFKLYVWETSSANRTAARNTTNYHRVDTFTPGDKNGKIAQNQTRELDFNTEEDGFYLAFQDVASCISLSRVIVFYSVCPGRVADHVKIPQTLAPRIGLQSPLVKVATVCVRGASPKNGISAKLICTQGGVWNAVTGSECLCNPGLVESGDGQSCIEGCPASQYLSETVQVKCRICPANSMSEVSGLPECPCVMGYYRRPEETDLPCTKPPGPPTNVQVVSVTPTAISLRWDSPKFSAGRNDTSYTLWYGPQGGNQRLAISTNATFKSITGLDPNVCYNFFVSAKNGVSSLAGFFEELVVVPLDQSCPLSTAGLIIGIIFLTTVILFGLGFIGLLLVRFYTYATRVSSSNIEEEMDSGSSHDVIIIREIQHENNDQTDMS